MWYRQVCDECGMVIHPTMGIQTSVNPLQFPIQISRTKLGHAPETRMRPWKNNRSGERQQYPVKIMIILFHLTMNIRNIRLGRHGNKIHLSTSSPVFWCWTKLFLDHRLPKKLLLKNQRVLYSWNGSNISTRSFFVVEIPRKIFQHAYPCCF